MTQSQSSRELAEQVMECRTWTKGIGLVDHETVAIALIEAYVRVREAKVLNILQDLMTALEPELTGPPKNVPKSSWAEQWEAADSVVSAARKELEPKRMQPAGEANDRS